MQNARKHTIPAGSETSVSRATIFESFGNSIRDVVPVANLTERALLVAALSEAGEPPSPVRPLLVYRGDAPGLHKVEVCQEHTGSVWVPATGVLRFASKAAADSWGVSNAAFLSAGDECWVAAARYAWSGSAWVQGSRNVAHEPSGAAIVGVNIAGAINLPDGVQLKTGRHTFMTTVSFGNEYAPSVTFATPFPNGLLSLQLTQIQADGALARSPLVYDGASATGFRAFYPGGAATTKRSFTWLAVGY